jgi:hypothetical protein
MAIEGKVARILNQRELTINRGSEYGVKEGMVFKVVELPLEILDPDTKVPLGQLAREKIRIKVAEVYPKFSVGRTYETYQTPPEYLNLGIAVALASRRVTKVRTLRTDETRISEADQAAVSVEIGDIVVEVKEESRVRD